MTARAFCLAIALLALAVSRGNAAAGAESTLREGMDEVMAVADQAKDGRMLAEKLEPVLIRRVCFESMTRRAIGPGWRTFTPEQQREATELFTKLIIRSYSSKFTPGERAGVEYLKGQSLAADRIELPTFMTYKGGRYSIVYRMEDRSRRWLVTDILAEGVSLVANYRAQFDELFKRGGATAVLSSLKNSVAGR